jgi:hypothetical protein
MQMIKAVSVREQEENCGDQGMCDESGVRNFFLSLTRLSLMSILINYRGRFGVRSWGLLRGPGLKSLFAKAKIVSVKDEDS